MAGKTPQKPVFPRSGEHYQKKQAPQRPVYDYQQDPGNHRRPAGVKRLDYGPPAGGGAYTRRPAPGRLDFHGPETEGRPGAGAPVRQPPKQQARPAASEPRAGRGAPPPARRPLGPEPAAPAGHTGPAMRQSVVNLPVPETIRRQSRPETGTAPRRQPDGGRAARPQRQAADGGGRRGGAKPKKKTRREGRIAAYFRRREEKRRSAPPPTPEQARRRRLRRKIMTGSLIAAVVLAGMLFSAALLFRVKEITVIQPEGGTAYTDEQIRAAFGQPLGENLFGFSVPEAQAQLEKSLPYLEGVSVERNLPGEILIRVSAAAESYKVQTSAGGWAVLSGAHKVLRLNAEEPVEHELTKIVGSCAKDPVPGEELKLDDAEKQAALDEIVLRIGEKQLVPVTEIDLTDLLELNFLYAGRVRIVLGTVNDMAYKMDWAWRLVTPQLEESLSETDTGILDVSRRNDEGRGKASFIRGSTDVSHAVQPQEDPGAQEQPDSGSMASQSTSAPVPPESGQAAA